MGIHSELLHYVIQDEDPSADFATTNQEHTYQLPMAGAEFEADNRMVYRKLKAFLIDGPG
jgi:hypothetical protein